VSLGGQIPRRRRARTGPFVNPGDTIAALATPLGDGGLAVVRLSGPKAFVVADRVFKPAGGGAPTPSKAPSHTVHYGRIVVGGKEVDEVLLTVFRAPRTFTREDTVEVSCHGGVLVSRRVLDALLDAGARAAEPGEFTQRAFLNGRIDLAQAEAVADLIHARTQLALNVARRQLGGELSVRVEAVRDAVMATLAHVEAHLDFPDEDIDPDTHEALLRRMNGALDSIQSIRKSACDGEILRRGVRAAIVGRPNAGKSSLLNRLLGRDRAIVSPIPGTTRDTLEETADIRGVPVVFVDTAGLRPSADPIEAEGIRRSEAAAAEADLVLWVVDASESVALHEPVPPTGALLVFNKADLPAGRTPPDGWDACAVSCVTGEGLDALRDRIASRVLAGRALGDEAPLAVNARHADALRRASKSLELAITALAAGEPLDLAALDLRAAAGAVGEITGHTTTEDLLDLIFSRFCLGK
jgi:tRNA modification GTPase